MDETIFMFIICEHEMLVEFNYQMERGCLLLSSIAVAIEFHFYFTTMANIQSSF